MFSLPTLTKARHPLHINPQPLTDQQALRMDEVQRANLRFAVISLGKEAGQRGNAGGGSLADVD